MAIWKKKETAGAADGAVAVQQPASPNNRKRIVRIVVIVVVAAVLIAVAASLFSGKSKGETNAATYTEYTVGPRTSPRSFLTPEPWSRRTPTPSPVS